MSIVIASYRHDSFSGLPDIIDAGSDLHAKGGCGIIHKVFGPIFIKYGVEEKLGLGLLHRHFDMEPSEQLIELNNISTLWGATDANDIGSALLENSWLFSNNELVPYEFIYQHGEFTQDSMLAALDGFLVELYAKLSALGLDKTLGLRRHPGPDFDGLVEVMVGKAKINFHPSKASRCPSS
ncbi:hypothetical protein CVT25_007094 [Psilocybe cyanescens]|uniref:Uncharacterized protein n=1 Tax=Psilocybe cyanescens TaxID=93625 RepID=A0A409XRE7_PSICY|nr:hypothetical protein CVT25_007094 [Psilocybe cyanescens]